MKNQLADFEKKYTAEQKAESSVRSGVNDPQKNQKLQKSHDKAKEETEKSQLSLKGKIQNYALERNLEFKVIFLKKFKIIIFFSLKRLYYNILCMQKCNIMQVPYKK